jgi:hypothetical protein
LLHTCLPCLPAGRRQAGRAQRRHRIPQRNNYEFLIPSLRVKAMPFRVKGEKSGYIKEEITSK